MTSQQLNTTQPPDLAAAMKEQAKRDGLSLSEWVGDCCRANLDADLAKNLGDRPPAHRPKQNN